jgi:hypothetical protein
MFNVCDNELIKFTFAAFKIVKTSLPVYSCEKSKHKYTQHQLMTLLCLMKRLKLDYRLFTSIIQLIPENISINRFKRQAYITLRYKNSLNRIGSNFIR